MSQLKSEVVCGVDEIQAAILPLMKAAGFQKRGRTFNRPVDDGVVHVVTFRVAGHYSCLYGTFHVELGVFIPEMYALENDDPPPKFLQEYHCEIRANLHELSPDCGDGWSAVSRVSETAAEFPLLFEQQVLPFFDRFSSRQSILAEWKSTGRLVYNEDRASLVAAVLLSSIGDTPGAAKAFHDAFSSDHKGFHEYVRSVATKLSVEL